MKLHLCILVTLLLFLAGCGSSERVVKVDEEFSINIGDKVRVYAADMEISYFGTGAYETDEGKLDYLCTIDLIADNKTERVDVFNSKPFETKDFWISARLNHIKNGCKLTVKRK